MLRDSGDPTDGRAIGDMLPPSIPLSGPKRVALADIVKAWRLALVIGAAIWNPVGGLVDRSLMPGRGIGIADQNLDGRMVAADIFHALGDQPSLGISRDLIEDIEPRQLPGLAAVS